VLRVDLTSGRIWSDEIEPSVYRQYLGGSALATYFLLRELKPGVDPLGPENVLVVMTSVINGTPISGANRYTMARLLNNREGFTAKDDKLPDRLYEGLENGPLAGQPLDRAEVAEMLRLYYEMRGWDRETGEPTTAKLAELELHWAAQEPSVAWPGELAA
jgi:aldehyde:ferredoxin oxidoreductase